MTNPHCIRAQGTIVARPGTTHLFVESPEHYYAVANADRVRLEIGDEVEFEATIGDQFAAVTAVNGRRLP
jgi:hypothetical protein